MSEGDKVPEEAQAAQTPLWDHLRRVPKDRILEIEMIDDEGNVYGHERMPIGLYAWEAADQLQNAMFFRGQIRGISDTLLSVVTRQGG
jgi:hypothetical protein